MPNRLNGWQRIGVILSILWVIFVGGIATIELIKYRDYQQILELPIGSTHPPATIFLDWIRVEPSVGPDDPLGILEKWERTFDFLHFLLVSVIPVVGGWLVVHLFVFTVSWVRAGFKLSG